MDNPQGPGFVMSDYTLAEARQSVGPGWKPLVDVVWGYLKSRNISIHQVKEKFARLVIYVGEYPDDVVTLLESTETQSLTICEDCGAPGRVRTQRYWIRTLCDACDEHMTPSRSQLSGWE